MGARATCLGAATAASSAAGASLAFFSFFSFFSDFGVLSLPMVAPHLLAALPEGKSRVFAAAS